MSASRRSVPRTQSVASARSRLQRAREDGRCAFVPYLTMGYPALETSVALLRALEEMGVDAIEVGIPFSDPVADGPTIQRTTDIALRGGTTLRRVLERLGHQDAAARPGTARIAFSYLNPLLAFGLDRVATALRRAGVGAALVTDLIPEEGKQWERHCRDAPIETCYLVASTSDEARVRRAAEGSSGFVYVVSTLGVTGARTAIDRRAAETVARVRAVTDVPVVVGFGISTPDDVRSVRDYADGVVVGSALLNAIGDELDPQRAVQRAVDFVGPLLEAAHG